MIDRVDGRCLPQKIDVKHNDSSSLSRIEGSEDDIRCRSMNSVKREQAILRRGSSESVFK